MDYIAELLKQGGNEVVLTREPGGTRTGEQIRDILLDSKNTCLSEDTELMLMFAARAQHIHEVIKPGIASGKIVICDRFTDSSFAYQGGGRGIDQNRIKHLEEWVQQGLRPDLTLLFDLDVKLGLERAGKRSNADRFEQEEIAFFERVRTCYLDMAKTNQQRYCIIDSSQSVEKVKQQIEKVLLERKLC